MTIGFAFILACLILVPCVFLFSGRDTDHLKAIRKECQRDWTGQTKTSSQPSMTLHALQNRNESTPLPPSESKPCPVNHSSSLLLK